MQQYSHTDFELIEQLSERHAMYAASLITGRTHQIRVHFSDCGFPLSGDYLYNWKYWQAVEAERAAVRLGDVASVDIGVDTDEGVGCC